jgi:transposase InsO family protein
LKAIKRVERGEGVLPLARELGISRKILHDWIKAWKAHGPEGLNRKPGPKPGPRKLKAFAYLAIILDAFSRRAVGWAFDDTLDASLAIAALEKAIAARRPARGSLIHHSDRGVQYASIAYRQRLADRDIAVSMSRPGNPFDNAKAESFMKTLKAEEINGKAFTDIGDARRRIDRFIAEVYNKERLHSALGYQSPLEFETAFAQNKLR